MHCPACNYDLTSLIPAELSADTSVRCPECGLDLPIARLMRQFDPFPTTRYILFWMLTPSLLALSASLAVFLAARLWGFSSLILLLILPVIVAPLLALFVPLIISRWLREDRPPALHRRARLLAVLSILINLAVCFTACWFVTRILDRIID